VVKNTAAAALLLVTSAMLVVSAQAPDFWAGVGELQQFKTSFVATLRTFAQSASGSYGDEGRLLSPQLDDIQRALESWDRALARFEAAAHIAPGNVDARAALGAAYLDRLRTRDALTELGAAARLDPRRADVHELLATAHELAGDRARAIAELEQATAIAPRNLASLSRLATLLAQTDSPRAADAQQRVDAAFQATSDAEALTFYRVGLVRQPAGVAPIFPPQRYVAGFRLIEGARFLEGLAALRAAVAGDPLVESAPTSTAATSGTRLRQGQLQAALSGMRGALAQSPEAETWRVAGVAYWADEQYDNSTQALTSAIRLNAGDERSRVALADVLVAAGRSTDAEQALKQTIALMPDSGQAHYRLAEVYRSQSLVANAVEEFERAVSCSPLVGLDYLYDTIGGLHATQADLDRAATAYRKRIDANPNSPDAHRKLGEIFALQGVDSAALAEFAVAARLDPKSSGDVLAASGQAYLRAGRFADAVRSSRAALSRDPTQQKARFTLGTALARLGNRAEGQRELDLFQRDIDSAATSRRRALEAKALQRDAARAEAAGNYAEAVSALRRALGDTSADVPLETELARMLVKAGQPDEALRYLMKASQLEDPAVHQILADAYEALGQRDARDREQTRYRQLVEQRKEDRLKTRPLLQ
jgi:tetratricopeptide (TPR) repeat protein